MDCSTINVQHRREPLVLVERSINTTMLGTANHSRSNTSEQKRPLSGLKIMSHRRTMTRMHPAKSLLS